MYNKYRKTLTSSNLIRWGQLDRKKQSRSRFIQKRRFRIKLIFSIILFFLILCLVVYFLFFSRFTRIKEIKINKITNYQLISEQELKKTVDSLINKKGLIFSQNNILIFKTASLGKILADDSRIEIFNIKKDWPNTLIVKIAESKPVALLLGFGDKKNGYLNSRGQIIYSSNKIKTAGLPVFYDKTEINLTDLAYVEILKNVLALILSQNQIKIDSVNVLEKGGIFEIEIITQEKWRILINSEANFVQQTNNLSLILKQNIKDRNNLEYIDLKFGKRIFYKLKD